MKLSLPWSLVVLHSALIVLFMFTLWNGWFVTGVPFDCFTFPSFLCLDPLCTPSPITSITGLSISFLLTLPFFCCGALFRALSASLPVEFSGGALADCGSGFARNDSVTPFQMARKRF